jgi:hypothetical protein
MRRIGLLVLALVASGTAVNAQPVEPRGTAGVVLGGGRTWDDESNIGGGAVAGGRAAWRVFGTTSLEVSADVLGHDRSGGFFEAEGRSVILGVSLLHRFGDAAAQPYLLGGVDVLRHTGSTTFDGLRTERRSTDPGYHFGGGLAVRIGERFEAGPEARLYMIQPEDGSAPAFAYWIGGRLAVRF